MVSAHQVHILLGEEHYLPLEPISPKIVLAGMQNSAWA